MNSAPLRTPTAGFACVLVALACVVFSSSATAEPEMIEMENGEKFEAEVLEERDDVLVVEHPIFGRIEIPRDQIKKEEEKTIEPGLFGTKLLQGWTRGLGFGLSGSTGNAEDVSINANMDVKRETDSWRGTFAAQYFYSSARGKLQKNQFRMNYLHDLLFGDSPWIITLAAGYDYDAFQTWRNRLSAQIAPGYDIIKNDRMELLGRLGVGVAQEFGSDPDTDPNLDPDDFNSGNFDPDDYDSETKPEGVVSLSYTWFVVDGQEFHIDTTYFPNFNDLPRFRMNSNAHYKVDLGLLDGLGLKFGVRNEYVSGQPGDNNTLNYYGNLTYDF